MSDSPFSSLSPATTNFELFSSLHYTPLLLSSSENTAICGSQCPFYLLPYHRDRMLSAAQNFQWPAKTVEKLQDLEEFRKYCRDGVDKFVRGKKDATLEAELDRYEKALKLRVILTITGTLTVEPSIIPAIPLHHLFPTTSLTSLIATFFTPYTIHLDTFPTTPSNLTRFKTTSRTHYDISRHRCRILSYAQKEEVVLYNQEERVMEGSLTNVYVCRQGVWITPTTERDEGKGAGGTGGTVRRWLLEKEIVKVEDFNLRDLKDGEWMYLSNGVRGMILGKIEIRQNQVT